MTIEAKKLEEYKKKLEIHLEFMNNGYCVSSDITLPKDGTKVHSIADWCRELTSGSYKKNKHYIWVMAPDAFNKTRSRTNKFFAFRALDEVLYFLLNEDYLDKQIQYINAVAIACNNNKEAKSSEDNSVKLHSVLRGPGNKDDIKFQSNCEIFNHAITLLKDQPSLSKAVKSKLTALQASIGSVGITANKTYGLKLSKGHETKKDYITELVTEVSKFTVAKSPEDKKEPRAPIKKWSHAIKEYGVLGKAKDESHNQNNADAELKKWIIVDPCRSELSGDGASGAIYKKMGGGSDCPEKPTAADYKEKLDRHEAVWNDSYFSKSKDKPFVGLIHIVGPHLEKATKAKDQKKLQDALKSVFETYCKQASGKANPSGLRIPLISLGIFNSDIDDAESAQLFMNALNGAYNELITAEKDFIDQQLKTNKIEICCYKKELYKGIMAAQGSSLSPKPSPESPAAIQLTNAEKLKEVNVLKLYLKNGPDSFYGLRIINHEVVKKLNAELQEAEKEAAPAHPKAYKGIGAKVEMVPQGLKITDIYAPAFSRFKTKPSGGDSFSWISLGHQESLKGKIITHIFDYTEMKDISLEGKSSADIIKLFRGNKDISFTTSDGNVYFCDNQTKSKVFAQNKSNEYVSLNQELENVTTTSQVDDLSSKLPIIKEAFSAAAAAKGPARGGGR